MKASKLIVSGFLLWTNLDVVVAPGSVVPNGMTPELATGKLRYDVLSVTGAVMPPMVMPTRVQVNMIPQPKATATNVGDGIAYGTIAGAEVSPDANSRPDPHAQRDNSPKVCSTQRSRSCLECVWFSDGASCSPGCVTVGYSRKVLPSTNITQASQCCRPTASVQVHVNKWSTDGQ